MPELMESWTSLKDISRRLKADEMAVDISDL
jgi:hypothetical protein